MNKVFDLANKLLLRGLDKSYTTLDLQVAMKLLGFMPRNYLVQCDNILGNSTLMAIKAFNYHFGLPDDSDTVNWDKINEILLKDEFIKVPFVEFINLANEKTIRILEGSKLDIIRNQDVPFEFIKAILMQETRLRHYDRDGFVFVGCDFGKDRKWAYQSRGWGIGQYTIKEHPPTLECMKKYIEDPLNNIQHCIDILKEKFRMFCQNKVKCVFSGNSIRYMNRCRECLTSSFKKDSVYLQANYHPQAKKGYKSVPVLEQCGWGEAIRKYNGGGDNSRAYRDEIFLRIVNK